MRAPEFWHRSPEAPGLRARLLLPASLAYDTAGRLRQRLARPVRLPLPVICAGGLTIGGAGKTPLAIALLTQLIARGRTPHALLRGYGGSTKGPLRVDATRHDAALVGDEALLLSSYAPVWVAADRPAGARAAHAAGADVVVMDDGFQNPSLAQDLSLLVVDGEAGLGNGRLLPAGPLRERPERALARAQALIVIGEGPAGGLPEMANAHGLPVLRAALSPPPLPPDLRRHPVVAFAGIARPAKFFTTLGAAGFDVVLTVGFPDHHRYTEREITNLRALAAARGAVLMTTEKDMVRLPPAWRGGIIALPVSLAFADPSALESLLESLSGLEGT